ncbi:MAG: glycosyltransferase [Planctomycetota bacterium]
MERRGRGDPPRVSVLLPVRDAEATLESALVSVLGQTVSEIEVIAVDDGSRDASLALLREWSRRDARLRAFPQPTAGVVVALQHALEEARAPLVARIDARDVLHPRKLERQLAELRDRSGLLVGCLAGCIPAEGRGSGERHLQWSNRLIGADSIAAAAFIDCPVVPATLLMHRADLLALGGFREVPWRVGYDLFLRAHVAGLRTEKVAKVLYYVRDEPQRLSVTDPSGSLESLLRAKAHYLARGPLRAVHRVVIFGAGRTGRRLANHLRREGVPLEAFVDHRAPGLPAVRGLEVHSPSWLSGARAFVVVALPSEGVRETVRRELRERYGLEELRDFIMAA